MRSRWSSTCWTPCSPQLAKADPRVKAVTELPGLGPLTALVIVAEVGDIARFPRPASSRPGPGSRPRSAVWTRRALWADLQAE